MSNLRLPLVDPDRVNSVNLGNNNWIKVTDRSGSDVVQATHRVVGNVDGANNYVTLTLGPRFIGADGNGVKISVSAGSGQNSMRYDEATDTITINSAANSISGVRTAVNTGDSDIARAGAVTGRSAEAPAPYSEHGTFSGGADAVQDRGREVTITVQRTQATGNSDRGRGDGVGIKISASSLGNVNPDYYISPDSGMVRFSVRVGMDLYVRRTANTTRVAINEYWTDLSSFSPQGARI